MDGAVMCPECGRAFDPTDPRSTLSHPPGQLRRTCKVLAAVSWALTVAATLDLALAPGRVLGFHLLVIGLGAASALSATLAIRTHASLDLRRSSVSVCAVFYVVCLVYAYVRVYLL